MNVLEILNKYYKGLSYASEDKIISWDETIPKPTDEELKEKWDEMKDEYELNLFRIERDKLLKESDVYALPDFPHKTQEIKEKWFNYRQALRNSTNDKILPTKPF